VLWSKRNTLSQNILEEWGWDCGEPVEIATAEYLWRYQPAGSDQRVHHCVMHGIQKVPLAIASDHLFEGAALRLRNVFKTGVGIHGSAVIAVFTATYKKNTTKCKKRNDIPMTPLFT
jgi:hypothetical protein